MSDVETKVKRDAAADSPASVWSPEPTPRETPRCQFGLPRHSDLAHEHNIERRIECLSNLEPDRDAAARQCQNHRLPVIKMRQLASEAATRIGAIQELHIPVSSEFGG
jgi:hypothetical protein